MRNIPELVAPAGDWPGLTSALANGCDSVYFGIKGLSMRHHAGNFDLLELPKLMREIHSQGRKGYLALNIVVFDRELERVGRILDKAAESGVDAVICWDMAVLSMARERGLPVHLSTQASVSNSEALKWYAEAGVSRVVLARECTLDDIHTISRAVKERNIGCGVEVFVHGAMCVSVSGRCFLSEYTFDQSANRGACVQPCRRKYRISELEGDAEYVLGEDYVLSPKDLCTIDFIELILESGAQALKIEGRMRSPEYAAVVIRVYREAIDAWQTGELDDKFKQELMIRLGTVYNRGFSSGFFHGQPQNWRSEKLEHTYEKIFVAEVCKYYNAISVAEVLVRAQGISAGDELLFLGKRTPAQWVREFEMQQHGAVVERVEAGQRVGIKVPFTVRPGDKVFVWRDKNIQKG
jgi:putative protease